VYFCKFLTNSLVFLFLSIVSSIMGQREYCIKILFAIHVMPLKVEIHGRKLKVNKQVAIAFKRILFLLLRSCLEFQ
jgi:hypothetical protein